MSCQQHDNQHCTDAHHHSVANSCKNGAIQASSEKLYLHTPVVFSLPMSRHSGFQVYLKLENLQPPGSFKLRGISHMIQKATQEGTCEHVYCASGGNAGLAAAYASHQLNISCTIILPSSTPQFISDQLKNLGAEVKIHGDVYDEAKQLAQELGKQQGSLYVPAFEHPTIWEGHSSMIVEAEGQLKVKPDVVITCVGGGGLLNGMIQGMRQVGWTDVPVLAIETQGANCFNAAIAAGEVVTLPAITSIAKSLGALSVSPVTLEYYKQKQPPIISHLVTDKEAVHACIKFAEDHRLLVEPACGATLAALYSNIIDRLIEQGDLQNITTVLAIVCGGSIVSTSVMEGWKKEFGL